MARARRSPTTSERPRTRVRERPFDIEKALPRLRKAVAPYPKAALFELAREGFSSVFEILVGCILSIRTRDETSLPVARQLLRHARTPAEIAALSVKHIDRLIRACAFHEPKARTIRAIARATV